MMDIYFVSMGIPSGKHTFKLLNMAIEIVDLPIENGGSFHSCVNVCQSCGCGKPNHKPSPLGV